MRTEINNRPQTNITKYDKKNKQDVMPAQQPNVQQNSRFEPKGNRYIRSWTEGAPDQQK
jgi:hypothetical protein